MKLIRVVEAMLPCLFFVCFLFVFSHDSPFRTPLHALPLGFACMFEGYEDSILG